jgi:putative phosphoribosyl transferase
MELTFTNEQGTRLAASLELPAAPPRPPVIVFAHGLGSDRHSSRNLPIANLLIEAGIGALLFDFTGHGDSGGTREDAGVPRMVGDLRAALDFVSQRDDVDPRRIGVSGSSSGGLVAVLAGAHDARIKAMVLRSVPARGLLDLASDIHAPTLVISGERDVPIVDEDRALADVIAGEHRFVVIPGAGHLFEGPGQIEEVAQLSASWFIGHLIAGGAPDRAHSSVERTE